MVKRYPKEFKRECIEYVRKNEDIPMSEAADNLGVPNSTLQRWLKQADIDDGNSKTGELTSAERLEFQRLKRENRKLKMEAEILKKAATEIQTTILREGPVVGRYRFILEKCAVYPVQFLCSVMNVSRSGFYD